MVNVLDWALNSPMVLIIAKKTFQVDKQPVFQSSYWEL